MAYKGAAERVVVGKQARLVIRLMPEQGEEGPDDLYLSVKTLSDRQ